MTGWSFLLLLLLVISHAADPPPPLYFNEKDVYHVTCWPVPEKVDTDGAKTKAEELRKTGYEYFGTKTASIGAKECLNWREATTVENFGGNDPDAQFINSGIPGKDPRINVEYYADHSQCRWLPMHSSERIDAPSIYNGPGATDQEMGPPLRITDPDEDGQRPASGPWCYVLHDMKPEPARCLPYCGATYETTRKRKIVPHKSIVPAPRTNHNPAFTEQLGTAFEASSAQRAKIYVKPSMVDHADELLEQKRYVFYGCCGVVGAVILWITVCHFLGLRVKRRRLAIVAIQRQAISASITRRRRESQAEHEEEDAREQ